MAGMLCPECGQQTLFKTPTGRRCTKCGFEVRVPINENKGGKGSKCFNCGHFTVRDGKCTDCGTEHISPSR